MKAVEITINGKTISHIKVLHMDSWGDNEHEERDCWYVVYDGYGEDGQKNDRLCDVLFCLGY